MVPGSRTAFLMHLAHFLRLGGHLGARNTLEKLKNWFTWPGMHAEVHAFCKACPKCQGTAPAEASTGTYSSAHQRQEVWKPRVMYTLGRVIMDYATQNPEMFPLPKAIPQNIARELLLLFTHVGISKKKLTD